ncbi:hypothetical protein [Cryobacterium sp. AP23]
MSATPNIRTRLMLVVAGIGLAGSLLAGCATATPDLNADTAAGLQDGVLTVSEAAANGDFAGAQAALEVVQADLTAATAADGVTDTRAAEIQTAIDLVATDLAAAVAGAPVETPEEAPAETPVETETPAPEETPVETPTETPEETEAPVVTDEPVEPEETTAPAPEPEKPDKDKSDNGACKKKDDCD